MTGRPPPTSTHPPTPTRVPPPSAPAPPSSTPSSLLGTRVCVVGTGEVLARTLGVLHRLGAACVICEDPYAAIAEISRRPGTYAAVTLVLPCLYPTEVSVIGAIHLCSPGTRVLVAAAEQQVTLLASTLRAGAAGVLTDSGVEWISTTPPPSEPPAEPEHQEAAYLSVEPTTEPTDDATTTRDDTHEDDDQDADPDDTEYTNADDDNAGLMVPIEPVLTAEELHALLHDEPVQERRGK